MIQQNDFTNTSAGKAFDQLGELSDPKLMSKLAEARRQRKQLVLVEVLKRSTQALLEDPDLLRIISKLQRCGREHSGKYDQMGRRRPGLWRCKLVSCPSCQERKQKKARLRAVGLVMAATNHAPDHRSVFLLTIDAEKSQSTKEFLNVLRRIQRKSGFKAVGWIQIGLTGNIHAHLIAIYNPGIETLKRQLTTSKAFPHVQVLCISQAAVLEGVENTIGYGVSAIHGRDAHAPGKEHLWCPDGLADWILLSERHCGSRKVEQGFTRTERGSVKAVSHRRSVHSILLTKMDHYRVEATCWVEQSCGSGPQKTEGRASGDGELLPVQYVRSQTEPEEDKGAWARLAKQYAKAPAAGENCGRGKLPA